MQHLLPVACKHSKLELHAVWCSLQHTAAACCQLLTAELTVSHCSLMATSLTPLRGSMAAILTQRSSGEYLLGGNLLQACSTWCCSCSFHSTCSSVHLWVSVQGVALDLAKYNVTALAGPMDLRCCSDATAAYRWCSLQSNSGAQNALRQAHLVHSVSPRLELGWPVVGSRADAERGLGPCRPEGLPYKVGPQCPRGKACRAWGGPSWLTLDDREPACSAGGRALRTMLGLLSGSCAIVQLQGQLCAQRCS